MSLLSGFKSIPLRPVQLSLAATLKCGQSFRWSILTNPLPETEAKAASDQCQPADSPRVEYRLCLKDRVVCLRQSLDTLYYRNVFPDPQPAPAELPGREAETLAWLKDYFQLDIDLGLLYKQWGGKDKVFAKIQDRFEGIRMLRQDPWENLVSFICSSNNNISRITKMVQNLCIHYSPALLSEKHPFSPSESIAHYPFPSPSALADPEVALHLRSLGFGYRADYIQRTANMLVSAHGKSASNTPYGTVEASELWLKELRQKLTVEAREELLKFVGVGRKVADCILLMSLDKTEVVPVDTHVYQIAVKHYGMKPLNAGKATMSPRLYEEISTKFFNTWGEYAGWAQTVSQPFGVLFTADLKSFSTYGLPSPSPLHSPVGTPQKSRQSAKANIDMQMPLSNPGGSPLKRKLGGEIKPELLSDTSDLYADPEVEFASLVDRVKKRRQNS